MNWLYNSRKLSEGYPDLATLGAEWFREHQSPEFMLEESMIRLGRLIGLSERTEITVVGCGPMPRAVAELLNQGYDVTAVEPVKPFVESAREYLGDQGHRVARGMAEGLPYEDESRDVLVLDQVLEHVDSPALSLKEAFRVLRPGGVCFVDTTNRLQFRLSGRNGEFRVRFFNWFPRLVQESYVFKHLHYDPKLSNFSVRPAVHWFSYTDLCQLGRAAGFAQFYHGLDLVDPEEYRPWQGWRGWGTRWLVRAMRTHPWLRAMVLSQKGGSVYMWKRG